MQNNLKRIVAACAAIVMNSIPAMAQDASLYDRLKDAEPKDAIVLEREIKLAMSRSGSPAMDLLLRRGRKALERGEVAAALDHLSALTDHAPNFAEGWHARARAHHSAGQAGVALGHLETALALNPNHFQALYGLGVILEEMNQPELAYDAYSLVLEIHPHYQDAQTARQRLQAQVLGQRL